jgi:hypothetical protein
LFYFFSDFILQTKLKYSFWIAQQKNNRFYLYRKSSNFKRMINNILQVFREQARRHRHIKSFYYQRTGSLGSGNEAHPVFWLEDPICGRNKNNIFISSVNFSILFVPDNEQQILSLQNQAFSTGLDILEYIKQDRNSPVGILPEWTYITLRDYYDNNACGCRFSVDFTHRNMQNFCLMNECFDDAGIVVPAGMPDDDATGNLSGSRLPSFNLV